jgi:hypothetical protein
VGNASAHLSLEGYPRNLILNAYIKLFQENPYYFEMGQKYVALYIKEQVVFKISDDFYFHKSPFFKGRGMIYVTLGEFV